MSRDLVYNYWLLFKLILRSEYLKKESRCKYHKKADCKTCQRLSRGMCFQFDARKSHQCRYAQDDAKKPQRIDSCAVTYTENTTAESSHAGKMRTYFPLEVNKCYD